MFRRKRSQSDFNAEIRAHIELEADRLRERGMSPEDARAAARRTFGNLTAAQERFYDSRRWLWLDCLRQDLRLAVRLLAKTPGWTTVCMLTATLGIGASVAMFSVVYASLLRPLPYEDADRLYWINARSTYTVNSETTSGDSDSGGMVLGIGGAAGLNRFLASLLLNVSPFDPSVFATSTAALLTAVVVACYVPGRRAADADPMIVLRHE